MYPSEEYYNDKLTFTDDGNLLNSKGLPVMMGWERDIMKHDASIICKNGGDILNIGFGLGIIDNYIQSHNPKSHWIIEYHPDVYNKMVEDGWLEKPNVNIIFKPWQEVLGDLPKFDGIYFDTWHEDQFLFDDYVSRILKEGGIYSFFNNPRIPHQKINSLTSQLLKENFDIIMNPVEIKGPIENAESYFDKDIKTYWSPECKLKKQ
tara:strand:+ start:562 stop:1179 length:618 start_codon:yes stop_codon:yes gene_type:complete